MNKLRSIIRESINQIINEGTPLFDPVKGNKNALEASISKMIFLIDRLPSVKETNHPKIYKMIKDELLKCMKLIKK